MSLSSRRQDYDKDIATLRGCIRWLNRSTSLKMLVANLAFLNDRYLHHPSSEILEHFISKKRRSS